MLLIQMYNIKGPESEEKDRKISYVSLYRNKQIHEIHRVMKMN